MRRRRSVGSVELSRLVMDTAIIMLARLSSIVGDSLQPNTTTLPAPFSISTPAPFDMHSCIAHADGIYGDPFDCRRYFHCVHQKTFYFRCFDGFVFDSCRQRCVYRPTCLPPEPCPESTTASLAVTTVASPSGDKEISRKLLAGETLMKVEQLSSKEGEGKNVSRLAVEHGKEHVETGHGTTPGAAGHTYATASASAAGHLATPQGPANGHDGVTPVSGKVPEGTSPESTVGHGQLSSQSENGSKTSEKGAEGVLYATKGPVKEGEGVGSSSVTSVNGQEKNGSAGHGESKGGIPYENQATTPHGNGALYKGGANNSHAHPHDGGVGGAGAAIELGHEKENGTHESAHANGASAEGHQAGAGEEGKTSPHSGEGVSPTETPVGEHGPAEGTTLSSAHRGQTYLVRVIFNRRIFGNGPNETVDHGHDNKEPTAATAKPGHTAAEAGHATEPGHAPEPGHTAEAGHTPEPSHAAEGGHTAEGGHATEPGHTAEPGHAPEAGHSAEAGHTAEAGHAAVNGHSAEPGHVTEAGHTAEAGHGAVTGHTAEPGHAPDAGHTAEPGHATEPGHVTEGSKEKPAHGAEATTPKTPGHAAEGGHVPEVGSKEKPVHGFEANSATTVKPPEGEHGGSAEGHHPGGPQMSMSTDNKTRNASAESDISPTPSTGISSEVQNATKSEPEGTQEGKENKSGAKREGKQSKEEEKSISKESSNTANFEASGKSEAKSKEANVTKHAGTEKPGEKSKEATKSEGKPEETTRNRTTDTEATKSQESSKNHGAGEKSSGTRGATGEFSKIDEAADSSKNHGYDTGGQPPKPNASTIEPPKAAGGKIGITEPSKSNGTEESSTSAQKSSSEGSELRGNSSKEVMPKIYTKPEEKPGSLYVAKPNETVHGEIGGAKNESVEAKGNKTESLAVSSKCVEVAQGKTDEKDDPVLARKDQKHILQTLQNELAMAPLNLRILAGHAIAAKLGELLGELNVTSVCRTPSTVSIPPTQPCKCPNLVQSTPDESNNSTEFENTTQPESVRSLEHHCRSLTCFNGAMYIELSNGQCGCLCPVGWRGDRCQHLVNHSTCHCANGGRCVTVGNGTYACMCPLGYLGGQCQYDASTGTASGSEETPKLHLCGLEGNEGKKCQNGGVCLRDRDEREQCYCPQGFIGDLCQNKL